ncbi:MAG: hypothetical protein M3462_15965 [Chloroflexota bacterium]|nr:hypothetical protein [Chloroflexota bacterium]
MVPTAPAIGGSIVAVAVASIWTGGVSILSRMVRGAVVVDSLVGRTGAVIAPVAVAETAVLGVVAGVAVVSATGGVRTAVVGVDRRERAGVAVGSTAGPVGVGVMPIVAGTSGVAVELTARDGVVVGVTVGAIVESRMLLTVAVRVEIVLEVDGSGVATSVGGTVAGMVAVSVTLVSVVVGDAPRMIRSPEMAVGMLTRGASLATTVSVDTIPGALPAVGSTPTIAVVVATVPLLTPRTVRM